jgi:hypothetical protein
MLRSSSFVTQSPRAFLTSSFVDTATPSIHIADLSPRFVRRYSMALSLSYTTSNNLINLFTANLRCRENVGAYNGQVAGAKGGY